MVVCKTQKQTFSFKKIAASLAKQAFVVSSCAVNLYTSDHVVATWCS